MLEECEYSSSHNDPLDLSVCCSRTQLTETCTVHVMGVNLAHVTKAMYMMGDATVFTVMTNAAADIVPSLV